MSKEIEVNNIEDIAVMYEKEFGEKIKYVNYCLSEGDEMIDIEDMKSWLRSTLTTFESQIRESERGECMHQINAKINNIVRQPEKPQKKLWFQEGFQDCLDQVMLILGKRVHCVKCMDRGYVRDVTFDYLAKCTCSKPLPRHIRR